MSRPDSIRSLHRLTWTALLAALIAAGAWLHFPLGPVPFSLQTIFVALAGLVLGPAGGAGAAALYVAAGTIGLPVFAGGGSGVGHLLGPTGGFLLSYLPAAAIAGAATRRGEGRLAWWKGILFGAAAFTCIYAVGIPWLKMVTGSTWTQALAVGLLPFLPALPIKLLIAVGTYRTLQGRRLLPS